MVGTASDVEDDATGTFELVSGKEGSASLGDTRCLFDGTSDVTSGLNRFCGTWGVAGSGAAIVAGGRLTVSKTFTALALFSFLRGPMLELPEELFSFLHGMPIRIIESSC